MTSSAAPTSARFGFGVGKADTKVGQLSGGEKARLLFALMTP